MRSPALAAEMRRTHEALRAARAMTAAGARPGADVAGPTLLAGARLAGEDGLFDLHLDGGRHRGDRDRLWRRPQRPLGAHRVDLDGRWVVPGLHDRHVHFSQWAMVSRRARPRRRRVGRRGRGAGRRIRRRGAREVIGFGYRDSLWPDPGEPRGARRCLGRRAGGARGGRPARLLAEHGRAAPPRRRAPHRRERPAARRRLLPPRPRDRRRRRRGARRMGRRRGRACRRARGRGHHRLRDALEPRRLGAARRIGLRCAARVVRHLHPAPRAGDRRGPAHRRRGARHRRTRHRRRLQGHHRRLAEHAHRVVLRSLSRARGATITPTASRPCRTTSSCRSCSAPPTPASPRPCTRSATGPTPGCSTRSSSSRRAAHDGRGSGMRGSIEHAQLLRRADVARFAALGVVASVQPEHAMDDRDVADRYWAGRTDRAFMLADLAAAGRRARARLRRARRAARPVDRDLGRRRALARRPGAVASRAGHRGACRARRIDRRYGASCRRPASRRTSPSSRSTRSRHPPTTFAACRSRRPCSGDASRTGVVD